MAWRDAHVGIAYESGRRLSVKVSPDAGICPDLVSELAVAAVPFLGGEFLPPLREGHFIVHMGTLRGPPCQNPCDWAHSCRLNS